MVPDKPVVLITKARGELKVFSDEYAGGEAWVLDWDNDVAPQRLSVVVDQSDLHSPAMGHRVKVERNNPGAKMAIQALRATFKTGEAHTSLSHTGRNTILAALRSLQLHIERDDVPPGIQESFFSNYDLPDPEALDRLCEALNC